MISKYCQTSNISCTLDNKIVDHSDVVGASLVGAAPSALLQLHLHFQRNTWFQWIAQRQLQDEMRVINILEYGARYIRDFKASH